MVNLDISSSAFYKLQSIIDLLCQVLGEDFKSKKRPLRDQERLKFLKEVKGMDRILFDMNQEVNFVSMSDISTKSLDNGSSSSSSSIYS